MNNKGFVRTIVLVIIAMFLLSYMGVDIRGILNSDIVVSFWSFIQNIYYNYIKAPTIFVLNYVLGLMQ